MVAGLCKQKIYLQKVLEEVWTTVDETYPYEDFGGVDWQEQDMTLRKKDKKAKDDDAFHLYVDGLPRYTWGESYVHSSKANYMKKVTQKVKMRTKRTTKMMM